MKKLMTVLIVLLVLTGCSKPKEELPKPVATMTVKDLGDIVIELDPNLAPNTVNNFIDLSNQGYYEDVIFHRIISGFMIQGGDPLGNGMGGPGYSIKGEFSKDAKHDRGVISMARTPDPDSAGSQFFIVHQDSHFLDGEYAIFGKVIDGMDHVDNIAARLADGNNRPIDEVVIEKITVDLNNYELKAVEKITN